MNFSYLILSVVSFKDNILVVSHICGNFSECVVDFLVEFDFVCYLVYDFDFVFEDEADFAFDFLFYF